MANDFDSLLDTSMDDIKPPVTTPPGTYSATVLGQPQIDKHPRFAGNPIFVRFNLGNLQPGEGVSPEALADITDLESRVMQKDYVIESNDRVKYYLKLMLTSLGIRTEGRSLRSCIPEAAGARVLIEVTNTTSKDGKEIYANVGEMRGLP